MQKRPIILRSLLIVATPYHLTHTHTANTHTQQTAGYQVRGHDTEHILSHTHPHTRNRKRQVIKTEEQVQKPLSSLHVKLSQGMIYTYCNTLLHTATRCNTLQHAATRCNTDTETIVSRAHQAVTRYDICILQHAVTRCNTLQHRYKSHCLVCTSSCHRYDIYILQHDATHCHALQHTATYRNGCLACMSSCHKVCYIHTAIRCNTLQHTRIHCNTLQYTATHYNTLQHTTIHIVHCNTLQHAATCWRWEL